jgi:hypothetical protein
MAGMVIAAATAVAAITVRKRFMHSSGPRAADLGRNQP